MSDSDNSGNKPADKNAGTPSSSFAPPPPGQKSALMADYEKFQKLNHGKVNFGNKDGTLAFLLSGQAIKDLENEQRTKELKQICLGMLSSKSMTVDTILDAALKRISDTPSMTTEEKQKLLEDAQFLLTQWIQLELSEPTKQRIGLNDLKNNLKISELIGKIDPNGSEKNKMQFLTNLLLTTPKSADEIPPPLPSLEVNTITMEKVFESTDSVSDLSNQLFNIFADSYGKIKADEFFLQEENPSSNLYNFDMLFDEVSGAVTQNILSAKNEMALKNRMLFYIKLAEECFDLGNLAAAQAILTAIHKPFMEPLFFGVIHSYPHKAKIQAITEVLLPLGGVSDNISDSDSPDEKLRKQKTQEIRRPYEKMAEAPDSILFPTVEKNALEYNLNPDFLMKSFRAGEIIKDIPKKVGLVAAKERKPTPIKYAFKKTAKLFDVDTKARAQHTTIRLLNHELGTSTCVSIVESLRKQGMPPATFKGLLTVYENNNVYIFSGKKYIVLLTFIEKQLKKISCTKEERAAAHELLEAIITHAKVNDKPNIAKQAGRLLIKTKPVEPKENTRARKKYTLKIGRRKKTKVVEKFPPNQDFLNILEQKPEPPPPVKPVAKSQEKADFFSAYESFKKSNPTLVFKRTKDGDVETKEGLLAFLLSNEGIKSLDETDLKRREEIKQVCAGLLNLKGMTVEVVLDAADAALKRVSDLNMDPLEEFAQKQKILADTDFLLSEWAGLGLSKAAKDNLDITGFVDQFNKKYNELLMDPAYPLPSGQNLDTFEAPPPLDDDFPPPPPPEEMISMATVFEEIDEATDADVLESIHVKGLSDQLLNTFSEVYSKITPDEFYNKAWEKPDTRQQTSPNLIKFNAFLNQLSNSVKENILNGKNEKAVKNRILFYVRLMEDCFESGDLYGAQAILSALQNSSIEPSFSKIKESYNNKSNVEEIEAIFSPKGNLQALRGYLEEHATIPLIVSTSIAQKDLVNNTTVNLLRHASVTGKSLSSFFKQVRLVSQTRKPTQVKYQENVLFKDLGAETEIMFDLSLNKKLQTKIWLYQRPNENEAPTCRSILNKLIQEGQPLFKAVLTVYASGDKKFGFGSDEKYTLLLNFIKTQLRAAKGANKDNEGRAARELLQEIIKHATVNNKTDIIRQAESLVKQIAPSLIITTKKDKDPKVEMPPPSPHEVNKVQEKTFPRDHTLLDLREETNILRSSKAMTKDTFLSNYENDVLFREVSEPSGRIRKQYYIPLEIIIDNTKEIVNVSLRFSDGKFAENKTNKVDFFIPTDIYDVDEKRVKAITKGLFRFLGVEKKNNLEHLIASKVKSSTAQQHWIESALILAQNAPLPPLAPANEIPQAYEPAFPPPPPLPRVAAIPKAVTAQAAVPVIGSVFDDEPLPPPDEPPPEIQAVEPKHDDSPLPPPDGPPPGEQTHSSLLNDDSVPPPPPEEIRAANNKKKTSVPEEELKSIWLFKKPGENEEPTCRSILNALNRQGMLPFKAGLTVHVSDKAKFKIDVTKKYTILLKFVEKKLKAKNCSADEYTAGHALLEEIKNYAITQKKQKVQSRAEAIVSNVDKRLNEAKVKFSSFLEDFKDSILVTHDGINENKNFKQLKKWIHKCTPGEKAALLTLISEHKKGNLVQSISIIEVLLKESTYLEPSKQKFVSLFEEFSKKFYIYRNAESLRKERSYKDLLKLLHKCTNDEKVLVFEFINSKIKHLNEKNLVQGTDITSNPDRALNFLTVCRALLLIDSKVVLPSPAIPVAFSNVSSPLLLTSFSTASSAGTPIIEITAPKEMIFDPTSFKKVNITIGQELNIMFTPKFTDDNTKLTYGMTPANKGLVATDENKAMYTSLVTSIFNKIQQSGINSSKDAPFVIKIPNAADPAKQKMLIEAIQGSRLNHPNTHIELKDREGNIIDKPSNSAKPRA